MTVWESIKKFWKFLNEDTWQSWIVSLLLIIGFIYFIFFPGLSFITQTELPLVVVESCSMYHAGDFDDWWFRNGNYYEQRDILKSRFATFPFLNGMNKGDIIFVWGRSDYEMGDVIIFEQNPTSSARHPIIHRIITEFPYGTKGDNNARQLTAENNEQRIDETNIPQERIMGKAVFRVPYIGWIKLVFFELARAPQERGFCS